MLHHFKQMSGTLGLKILGGSNHRSEGSKKETVFAKKKHSTKNNIV